MSPQWERAKRHREKQRVAEGPPGRNAGSMTSVGAGIGAGESRTEWLTRQQPGAAAPGQAQVCRYAARTGREGAAGTVAQRWKDHPNPPEQIRTLRGQGRPPGFHPSSWKDAGCWGPLPVDPRLPLASYPLVPAATEVAHDPHLPAQRWAARGPVGPCVTTVYGAGTLLTPG